VTAFHASLIVDDAQNKPTLCALKPEITGVFTENFESPRPLNHVNRQFHAPMPNVFWLSDFLTGSTIAASWSPSATCHRPKRRALLRQNRPGYAGGRLV